MNCKNFKYKLIDLIEGNLTGELKNQLEQHIAECADCSFLYTKLHSSFNIIEQEKKIQANPFLFTRVMAKIEKLEQPIYSPIPVYQRILQPVIITFIVMIGIFIGTQLGNIYSTESQNKNIPTELSYINDMSMESLTDISN